VKYVFLALGSVLVLVVWLNTPSGASTKRNLLEARDASTRYLPVE
jgi:hypothetical protein